MNVREILEKLKDIGVPDTVIAKEVGVGRHTIWSIRTGRTTNCYSQTADKIRELYEEKRRAIGAS